MTTTRKEGACESCGAPLTHPCDGGPPEPHDCGREGCVICPTCGQPTCASDPAARKAKAEKIKGLIQAAPPSSDGADSSDGSDGSDGGKREGKQLAAVDPFPTDVLPAPPSAIAV